MSSSKPALLRTIWFCCDALLHGAALEKLAAIASSGNNHVLLVRLGAGARCAEFVPAACCAAL